MSYILDALKKLEEKDGREGGGGPLSGGGRPARKRTGRAVAAAVVLAAAGAAVFAMRGKEAVPTGDEPAAQAVRTTGGGTAEPPAAETAAGELGLSGRDVAVAASGGHAAAVPAAPAVITFEPPLRARESGPEVSSPREGTAEAVQGQVLAGQDEEKALPPADAVRPPWEEILDEGEPAMLQRDGTVSAAAIRSGEAAGPEAGRLYHLQELPGHLRKEIGDLAMTGHIFSDDPSFRVIMISDRAMKEGDTVSPGVVLREITEDGAHFSFRGYLFLVEAL